MLLLAAAWAFAEAIFLFIVADVPISWIAVRHGWRQGVAAALAAALAAAAGGALLHLWATADPAGAHRMVAALPGIDEAMIAETARQFREDGYRAMLAGSLSGVPYKLYVLAAAGEGRALLPFLLISPLVRLPRFAASALIAAGLSHLLSGRLGMRGRLILLGGFWIAFYLFYFAVIAR